MAKKKSQTVAFQSGKQGAAPKHAFTQALMVVTGLACAGGSLAKDPADGSIAFIFKPANGVTQFAIWVEDSTGEYVGTVYVTNFIGRRGGGNRTGDSDIDSNDGNRLSALPIWAHRRGVIDTTYGIVNYYPPASSQPSYPEDLDAVSRPSPNATLQTKSWRLPGLPQGRYFCWIEANRSFDFNPFHRYSFYRGQPSVAWNATLEAADAPDSNAALDYAGYGSPDGSDGILHAPDSTITTAADLLVDLGGAKFKVVYTPDQTGMEQGRSVSASAHSFILDPNFPNPFNRSTLISYHLTFPAFVTLKIVDPQGKEIRTLVEKFQATGSYAVPFDAGDLPSGVYVTTLRINNAVVKTRKMVLLR
jgi:hypothetical protein